MDSALTVHRLTFAFTSMYHYLFPQLTMGIVKGSFLFLGGLLASTAFGLYPHVLPANTDPARGLTVFDSAAAGHGLTVALWWWIPGMLLVLGYFDFLYRNLAGKVDATVPADAGRSAVSTSGTLLQPAPLPGRLGADHSSRISCAPKISLPEIEELE